VTAAVRVPLAAGLKVTLIAQLAPAATLEPQLLDWVKSPALAPDTAMLLTLKSALPELVRVIVCADVVAPTAWLANARLEGERPGADRPRVSATLTLPPPPQDVANMAIATQSVLIIIAVQRLSRTFPCTMALLLLGSPITKLVIFQTNIYGTDVLPFKA
jgi:hypothetical protein